jgi:hypothetical protein
VCVRQPSPLIDSELCDLASMIGVVEDPVGRSREGGMVRYSENRQIIDAGFVLTDELRKELGDLSFGGVDSQRPGLFETFHTDDTYTERPAFATVLHARELPAGPRGDARTVRRCTWLSTSMIANASPRSWSSSWRGSPGSATTRTRAASANVPNAPTNPLGTMTGLRLPARDPCTVTREVGARLVRRELDLD